MDPTNGLVFYQFTVAIRPTTDEEVPDTVEIEEIPRNFTSIIAGTVGNFATNQLYRPTESDFARGSVTIIAIARGIKNGVVVFTDEDTKTVFLPSRPTTSEPNEVTSTAASTSSSDPMEVTSTTTTAREPAIFVNVGQCRPILNAFSSTSQVTYQYLIKNTGNVPFTSLLIQDSLRNGGAPETSSNVLPPGGEISRRLRYDVTQSDFAAGTLSCSAAAQGLIDGAVVAMDSASRTTMIPEGRFVISNLSRSLLLNSNPPRINVSYRLWVRFGQFSSFEGVLSINGAARNTDAFGPLAAGGTEVSITRTYLITPEDVSRGFVTFVVNARGFNSDGDEIETHMSGTGMDDVSSVVRSTFYFRYDAPHHHLCQCR